MRGDGLTTASEPSSYGRSCLSTTAHQFPILRPGPPARKRREDLQAGSGCRRLPRTAGPGFLQRRPRRQTANTLVARRASQRCVVILSNDVRAEAGFTDSSTSSSATPASPTTGSMATRPASREFNLKGPALPNCRVRSIVLSFGIVNQKRAPCPGLDSAPIRPPNLSTMRLHAARPIPEPGYPSSRVAAEMAQKDVPRLRARSPPAVILEPGSPNSLSRGSADM